MSELPLQRSAKVQTVNTHRFGVQLKVDRPEHVGRRDRSKPLSGLGLDRLLLNGVLRLALSLAVDIPPEASLENQRELGGFAQGFASQKRSQHFVSELPQVRPSKDFDIMDDSDLHMEFVDITDVTSARARHKPRLFNVLAGVGTTTT